MAPSVRCFDGVSDTLGVRHQSVRASGGEDHAHPLAPCHAGAARRGCCGRPLPPIQRTRRESVSSRRRSGRCLRSPTSGHLARVDQRTAARACSRAPRRQSVSKRRSGTPVWSRETARQVCDESHPEGGQAPDQANSGRQAGVAVHARTIHSEGTQTRPDARRVTNDTETTQPGNRP